jgi:type VI secretion system secreted protein Hcp
MLKHHLKMTLVPIMVALLFVFPLNVIAANAYLKIADIKGESSTRGHRDEIDVLSWSWGMSKNAQTTGASRRTGASICVEDLIITKHHDGASPELYQALSGGTSFAAATLAVRKPGGKHDYILYEMSNVTVTSVSTGDTGDEAQISETIGLKFQTVKGTYTPGNQDGSAGQPETWTAQTGRCQ